MLASLPSGHPFQWFPPAKPPLPSTPSSTRSASTRALTRKRSSTASTWPSVRRDPPWPSWWRGWQTPMLWSTPSWCPPPHLTPLLCSTWLHTPAAPWASTQDNGKHALIIYDDLSKQVRTWLLKLRSTIEWTFAVFVKCWPNPATHWIGNSCEGERFTPLAQIGCGFATLTNRKRLGLYKVTSSELCFIIHGLFNGLFFVYKTARDLPFIHWFTVCAWSFFHILVLNHMGIMAVWLIIMKLNCDGVNILNGDFFFKVKSRMFLHNFLLDMSSSLSVEVCTGFVHSKCRLVQTTSAEFGAL